MTNKKSENEKENQGINTGGGFYEIHVKGHLDDSWSDWLEGLEVKLLDNGEMILSGHIGDQAALMGILNKLYGLNLALLSVSEVGQKNDLKNNQIGKTDDKIHCLEKLESPTKDKTH